MIKRNHISVRTDRETGDIWLYDERAKRRIGNFTDDVNLALCADIIAVENTQSTTREVKFADGMVVRITVEQL